MSRPYTYPSSSAAPDSSPSSAQVPAYSDLARQIKKHRKVLARAEQQLRLLNHLLLERQSPNYRRREKLALLDNSEQLDAMLNSIGWGRC